MLITFCKSRHIIKVKNIYRKGGSLHKKLTTKNSCCSIRVGVCIKLAEQSKAEHCTVGTVHFDPSFACKQGRTLPFYTEH